MAFVFTVAFGAGVLTERRNSDSSQSMASPVSTSTDQLVSGDATPRPTNPASGEPDPPSPAGTDSIPPDPPATTTTTTQPPRQLPVLWAVASSTAPAATGDDGRVISHGAMNVVDGFPDTAWRTLGDGVGESIHIRLTEPAEIVRIDLLSGSYATDTPSGADPCSQDRETGAVRWIFEDGAEVIQKLSTEAQIQSVEIPGAVSTMVVAEIVATAHSDGDACASISEIEVYGHQPDGERSTTATETYSHVFPLDPPGTGTYNPGGHGYPATDIFAPEGTPFVAVTSGSIDVVSVVDVWDPAVNDGSRRGGIYVGFIGDDGIRYYGSHLSSVVDGIAPGVRVVPGQLLGYVGRSGNARETTPHLHFGLSTPTYPGDWQTRRGQIDPVAFLDAWRSGDEMATPELSDVE